jgi:hypothetical protein
MTKFRLHYLLYIISVGFLSSCGTSTTTVWDYYVKNVVESHTEPGYNSSKTKVLYLQTEGVNKAQLELIAYKNDRDKFLVIGSHKVAKGFYLNDTLYNFDVTSLYSHVRGNDFIRQMGDLTIFFTHIDYKACEAFVNRIDKLKSDFMKGVPAEGSCLYYDLNISRDVFVSIEKKTVNQQPEEANIWVGRRKHTIKLDDLIKAMQELKSFN